MTTLQYINDGRRVVISSNRSAVDLMVALLQAAFSLAEPRQVPGGFHPEFLPEDKLSNDEAKAFFGHGAGTLSMARGRCFFFFARVSGPNTVSVALNTYEGAPVPDLVREAERLLREDERRAVHF